MTFNLNKIFRLQIRGKLVVAFAALSILPVIIIGLLGLTTSVRTLNRVAMEDLNHDLLSIKERLSSFFTGLEESMGLLATSTSFQHFLQAVDTGDSAAVASALRALEPDLISFAERKAIFYQIKFVDSKGYEQFIIEKDRAGAYRLMPASFLNQSGTSFYLYLAQRNPSEKAIFLPVELIGRESQTLLPGISCIYPVPKPQPRGLLVFQIHAQAFFDVVEQKTPHSPSGKVMLVNSEGYYLYHSLKKKEWNRLLASKDSLNIKTEYGEQAALKLLSTSSEPFIDVHDEIVAHAPLFTEHEGLGGYTLVKSVSKEKIYAPTKTFTKIFVGLTGLFLLIALGLAYLATHQFTEPIAKLRREASVIARGDYHARVNVSTYDEIEELAHQFNVMAQSLEQREAEIESYREHLEQTVERRTRELRGEKDKLQAILDNVPSGFILLDKNYRILSASAALEAITGKPVRQLLGRSCYEVLGNGQRCPGCPGDEAFRTTRMQTRASQYTAPDGEERHLEHVSIPLFKHGKVEQMLEIITDVTERDLLQEQLIRSERLAATGEMAAVIAHEMRNSLTSVRMILQLFARDVSPAAPDSESLDVALDSVHRMERVVTDLLTLARPASLERVHSDINAIIRESVEFSMHEIEKRKIELVLDLHPGVPQLALDREHMKEVFVNLILNAAQAIQNEGTIEIRSQLKTLTKRYRELGNVSSLSGESGTLKVEEVLLKKGEEVVQVDVKDSGCGISRANMKRLFDAFYTTKTDGTGLGLSFVKRVVSQHGGLVVVQSRPGEGSCFSIMIPRA